MQKLTGKYLVLAILLIAVGLLIFSRMESATTSKIQPDQVENNSSPSDNLRSQMDGIPTQAGRNLFMSQSNNLTSVVDPELLDLDSQIISCDSNMDKLLSDPPNIGGSCLAGPTTLSSAKGKYLSGQCCGVLKDTKEYHENLEKLQAYKDMPDIILDPYHTPIDLAKKWIDYDRNAILTADEQKIYDQAFDQSKEKPCCCKCWHYFVNEGIAKKMIVDGQFNSKQIADYWDASDICGT